MADPICKFKINGVPKDSDYNKMPFGRRLEHAGRIANFKVTAASVHLSQKRRPYGKVIREAIKLYDVDQYYCCFYASEDYFDDSFQFWYTTN